jgi:hypothetical protein
MDFEPEQLSIGKQRANLETELQEAICNVSTIRDQIAALDVYEAELRQR